MSVFLYINLILNNLHEKIGEVYPELHANNEEI